MANGGPRACCVIGLCCRAGSPEQRQALIETLHEKYPNMPQEALERKADSILKKHDHFRGVVAIAEE